MKYEMKVVKDYYFHCVQYFYPDNEEFRLGIQKCRKTIQDAVADSSIFHGESMDSMFKLMRKVTEIRSIPKVGGKVFCPQSKKAKAGLSFAGVTTLMDARENSSKLEENQL